MPAERVSMRQAREIIRLKFSASLPTREIARRLGLAPSTVRETLSRLDSAGLSWPLPEGIGDAELEAALYANRRSKRGHRRHVEPDWPAVHRELKRKHVTLLIVWDEYIAANPGGYSYSRFCELYRGFEAKLSPTMRQTHAAGERLFVDYAGDGVPVVVDRLTGEIRMAQIFVAVLGTRASPSRTPAGRRRSPTGSTPTCVRSRRSTASRNCLCRTIRRPPSSRPGLRSPGRSDLCRNGGALRSRRLRRGRGGPGTSQVDQARAHRGAMAARAARHRTLYSLSGVDTAIADLMTHLDEQRRSVGSAQRAGKCWRRSSAIAEVPAGRAVRVLGWRRCRVSMD